MAKNILVIDNSQKRWSILHKFEERQKALFLKRLSVAKAMKMLEDCYKFIRKSGDNSYYKNINLNKINTLSKVHFLFMKVNP